MLKIDVKQISVCVWSLCTKFCKVLETFCWFFLLKFCLQSLQWMLKQRNYWCKIFFSSLLMKELNICLKWKISFSLLFLLENFMINSWTFQWFLWESTKKPKQFPKKMRYKRKWIKHSRVKENRYLYFVSSSP